MFILAEFPRPRTSCSGMMVVRATEPSAASIRAQGMSSSSLALRYFKTFKASHTLLSFYVDFSSYPSEKELNGQKKRKPTLDFSASLLMLSHQPRACVGGKIKSHSLRKKPVKLHNIPAFTVSLSCVPV